MKPMADYGPAIENLDWSTGKILEDTPYTYPGTDIAVHDWDNQFMGAMTMRRALTLSRNIPAIRTLADVGIDDSSKFLKKLGIEFKQMYLGNAISSNTNVVKGNKYGVSSQKISAAYAAFANGGIYYKPYFVNKIEYQDETVQEWKPDGHRAMKESTAYMITDMLKDVISTGTGNNAKIEGLFQAGKTGTSNYDDDELAKINSPYQGIAPDENFVGYTPYYALGIWTGYTNRMTPLTPDDFLIASEVYKATMEYAMRNKPNVDWEMPDSVYRMGTELYLRNAKPQSYDYIPTSTTSSSSTTEESTTDESSSSSESSESSAKPEPSSSEPAPEPSSSEEPVTPAPEENNDNTAN
jgi:penicillin-binding protein 1A